MRSKNAGAFSMGLLRCIIAMSIADNILEDDEISEILRVYKQLTEWEVPEPVIRETADGMMKQGVSIELEIKNIARTLDEEQKETLILASLYILAADGDIAARELDMLEKIRTGLGLEPEKVEEIKTKFFAGKNLTSSG